MDGKITENFYLEVNVRSILLQFLRLKYINVDLPIISVD